MQAIPRKITTFSGCELGIFKRVRIVL